MHSAVADAKPWPEWLCPSGDLVSPLRPLDDVSFRQADDVPCLSDGSEEKELAVAAKEETQEEKEKHKKAAVSAKLAQGEEEARAQAAVAAKRKQAATLVGSRRCGVGSKSAR